MKETEVIRRAVRRTLESSLRGARIEASPPQLQAAAGNMAAVLVAVLSEVRETLARDASFQRMAFDSAIAEALSIFDVRGADLDAEEAVAEEIGRRFGGPVAPAEPSLVTEGRGATMADVAQAVGERFMSTQCGSRRRLMTPAGTVISCWFKHGHAGSHRAGGFVWSDAEGMPR